MKILEHGKLFEPEIATTIFTLCPECAKSCKINRSVEKDYTFFGKTRYTCSYKNKCTECGCLWSDKEYFYGNRNVESMIDGITTITFGLGILGIIFFCILSYVLHIADCSEDFWIARLGGLCSFGVVIISVIISNIFGTNKD